MFYAQWMKVEIAFRTIAQRELRGGFSLGSRLWLYCRPPVSRQTVSFYFGNTSLRVLIN
jgi:hypothetical protein